MTERKTPEQIERAKRAIREKAAIRPHAMTNDPHIAEQVVTEAVRAALTAAGVAPQEQGELNGKGLTVTSIALTEATIQARKEARERRLNQTARERERELAAIRRRERGRIVRAALKGWLRGEQA